MQLFTQQIEVSSRTHDFSFANTAATHTANGTTKRTAWYPAFGLKATWSPIG